MKEILEKIRAIQANHHGLADPQAAIAALTLEFMVKAAEEIEALKPKAEPEVAELTGDDAVL